MEPQPDLWGFPVLRESHVELDGPIARRSYTFSASIVIGLLIAFDAIVIGACGFVAYAGIVGWRPGGLDYYVPAITFVALANFMLSQFAGLYSLRALMNPLAYLDRLVLAVCQLLPISFRNPLFDACVALFFSALDCRLRRERHCHIAELSSCLDEGLPRAFGPQFDKAERRCRGDRAASSDVHRQCASKRSVFRDVCWHIRFRATGGKPGLHRRPSDTGRFARSKQERSTEPRRRRDHRAAVERG